MSQRFNPKKARKALRQQQPSAAAKPEPQRSPLEIRRFTFKKEGYTLFIFRLVGLSKFEAKNLWATVDSGKIAAHIQTACPEFTGKIPEILKGDGENCPIGVGQVIFR